MKTSKMKFLTSYLLEEKLLLFTGSICTVFRVFLDVYLPIVVSSIIDSDLVNMENFYPFLIQKILLYFGLNLIVSGLFIAIRFSFNKLACNIAYKIQFNLIKRMQNFKMQYFDSSYAGDLVSRFTTDTNTIKELYQTLLNELLAFVLNLFVMLIVMFYISPYLFLIVLIYLPMMYVVTKYYGQKLTIVTKTIRKHEGITSSIYNETIKSLPVIQVYGNEDLMIESFERENEEVQKNYIKRTILNALFSWNLIDFVMIFTNAMIILVFTILKINGLGLSVGILYVLIEYNKRILKLFMNFLSQINRYKTALVSCDRIIKIFEIEEEKTTDRAIELEGNIEFKNVGFEYKENVPVLKDVNFKLDKGKSIAFVGATGSGKSTIMNLILGFYENQKGDILLDGQNIKTLSKASYRKQMAVVLQDPYIFTGSIRDNITLKDESITESEVLDAIVKVGGKNLLQKRDNNLDYELAISGSDLSLGEKQIICFARAIVRNPKVLILDEATANIDTETEKIINYGIEVLKQGRSTMIIAHRLSTVKNCDTIVMIENGKVLETGTHDELIALNGKYKTWYEIQSAKGDNNEARVL
ncbi:MULTISPECIES: ABC transporter ATP-binding protein [unclassified Parvimonas]|uniref:ABC transporter ATP-binding protein n=1 Tax=unclassified Parvimonas TaxID=1151464 RepID=UPI002B470C5D|nr:MULTISPECIES: ABC transporter ATP-binding protein [unclassified Parvimonas]MEB3025144.1 ABC transporter ATP-binding protein [Parvimonas sp. M13]MEB3089142.1 ABC transporter ATP-binding protein [Parvimonas sp. M20]